MSDERIDALREVATDRNEYSGWVNLAQGALDVIDELRREHQAFLDALTGALNEHGVPAMPSWREAIDWLAEHGGKDGW